MDNTRIKCKTFSKNKDVVENIEKGTKLMITSIDKIYTMNMEIEAQHIQFKKEQLFKELEYFKFQDQKINNTQMYHG
jgi:hypothetical protein